MQTQIVRIRAVLVAASSCVFLLAANRSRAQDAPPTWVPFSAQMIERTTVPVPGRDASIVEMKGSYLRDSHGSSYQKLVVPSIYTRSGSPLAPEYDLTTLQDRPNRSTYSIDYRHMVVHVRHDKEMHLAVDPRTREQFDSSHVGQERLGTKIISGIECEGYRVPNKYSKKRLDEMWYAPSLNFMAVRATTYTQEGHKIEMSLEDIRLGVEPDPSLFKLPEGFKVVGK